MGLDFKKIKGLFVTENEDKNIEKGKVDQENKVGNVEKEKDILEMMKNKEVGSVKEVRNTGGGKLDQKILDSLVKALEDNNMPGEDYMEFAQALKSMDNIPLEESVKIQTVLATLSTRGLTKVKIIESGAYYIDVLGKEKSKFGKAMEKQMKDGISSKNEAIIALEELNKTKSGQIVTLTQEITDNQKEIEALKTKISENDLKIRGTEDNFNITFNFVVNQLQTNIDKISALDPPKSNSETK